MQQTLFEVRAEFCLFSSAGDSKTMDALCSATSGVIRQSAAATGIGQSCKRFSSQTARSKFITCTVPSELSSWFPDLVHRYKGNHRPLKRVCRAASSTSPHAALSYTDVDSAPGPISLITSTLSFEHASASRTGRMRLGCLPTSHACGTQLSTE